MSSVHRVKDRCRRLPAGVRLNSLNKNPLALPHFNINIYNKNQRVQERSVEGKKPWMDKRLRNFFDVGFVAIKQLVLV